MRIAALTVIALAVSTPALAGEAFFTQQGRLLDSMGDPVNGEHDLRVSLYDDGVGTTELWRLVYDDVDVQDGYYSLGVTGEDDSTRSLDTVLSANTTVWTGVAIDLGDDLLPLHRVPSSTVANTANSATYRYWRLTGTALQTNDGTAYLGGFTVFSGPNGTGDNLGNDAGTTAYSVPATTPTTGGHWDPPVQSAFMTLVTPTTSSGGRVQCNNATLLDDDLCYVTLDLGSPQTVGSFGWGARPNAQPGNWVGVELSGSNDGSSFTLVGEANVHRMTQNQIAIQGL